jgi:hypothetical protein
LVDRRLNAATARGNLLVRRAGAAFFKLACPSACEDRMRVRIDKSRQHNAPTRIDDTTIIVDQRLDFIRGPDLFNQRVANKHSTTFDDAQIP